MFTSKSNRVRLFLPSLTFLFGWLFSSLSHKTTDGLRSERPLQITNGGNSFAYNSLNGLNFTLDNVKDNIEPYFKRGLSHAGTLDSLNTALTSSIERGVIKIAVAGGSVSVGSGCAADPAKTWFMTLKAVLERDLASRGRKVDIEIYNVAQGATGPQRVAYCFKELIPEKVDVAILEYAINESDGTWSEVLLRQFLANDTAVIFLETFSLGGKEGDAGLKQTFSSSQLYHDVIARYYDVPVISARDAFRRELLQSMEGLKMWFSEDNHHPSCFGHTTLGLLAAQLIFQTLEEQSGLPVESLNLSGLPLLDLSSQMLPEFMMTTVPECFLATAGLAEKQRSSWGHHNGPKPTFDCSSPEDGELSIQLKCRPKGLNRDFCQIVVAYTKSWAPLGTAKVFFNSSSDAIFEIEGYAEGFPYTVQVYTDIHELALRIPLGETMLRFQCAGNLSAPTGEQDEPEKRVFQLHGVILL